MTLAAKLQLRAAQSLVMTPQLMQSIRLLQLTHQELERFIDEEIEKNPLLARAEPAADTPPAAAQEPGGADTDWFERGAVLSAESMAGTLDTSLENLFPDDPGRRERLGPALSVSWRSAGGGAGASGEFDLDDLPAGQPSLAAQLRAEIGLRFRDPAERRCAEALADELDESGYCRADLGALGQRLGLSPARIEAVLFAVQEFEPAGIFARDLAECLGLQLRRRDRLDPAMRALLGRLDLLAKRDFSALSRLCGVDGNDLLDMLGEIRRLDPRPALSAGGAGAADAIVPDVEVRAGPDGAWQVELNPAALPRVLVDQSYYALVAGRAKKPDEKQFMSACLQSANWLARSLDSRARTILKVAAEIVKRQDAFLLGGPGHLKPLNLKTVADSIGMHESTVSRVTANKYMLTPRGVFELRFFFSAAIAAADGGESHSALAVQDRIRRMIAAEAPDRVLSDDAIVVALKESGVEIARRTVAKYREGLAIPSSVERRREKRARAGAAARVS